MNCGLKNEFSTGRDPFSPFVKKTVVEKGVLGAVRSTLGAKINIIATHLPITEDKT